MGFSNNFRPTWGSGGATKPSSGGSGGDFEDAPSDGYRYVRRNGQWVRVPYATAEQTIARESGDSVVTPESLGGLLDDMGVTKDDDGWVNDQGEF